MCTAATLLNATGLHRFAMLDGDSFPLGEARHLLYVELMASHIHKPEATDHSDQSVQPCLVTALWLRA